MKVFLDMLYFANIFKDCPTKIYQQKCILGLSNNYVIVERGRVSSNNCIFTWGRSGGRGGAGGQMIIVLPRNDSADDYSVPWF